MSDYRASLEIIFKVWGQSVVGIFIFSVSEMGVSSLKFSLHPMWCIVVPGGTTAAVSRLSCLKVCICPGWEASGRWISLLLYKNLGVSVWVVKMVLMSRVEWGTYTSPLALVVEISKDMEYTRGDLWLWHCFLSSWNLGGLVPWVPVVLADLVELRRQRVCGLSAGNQRQ